MSNKIYVFSLAFLYLVIYLFIYLQWLPFYVEAALERLTREVKESELRTMCLQVVRKNTIIIQTNLIFYMYNGT